MNRPLHKNVYILYYKPRPNKGEMCQKTHTPLETKTGIEV